MSKTKKGHQKIKKSHRKTKGRRKTKKSHRKTKGGGNISIHDIEKDIVNLPSEDFDQKYMIKDPQHKKSLYNIFIHKYMNDETKCYIRLEGDVGILNHLYISRATKGIDYNHNLHEVYKIMEIMVEGCINLDNLNPKPNRFKFYHDYFLESLEEFDKELYPQEANTNE
jgi:hypothetical protein